MTTTNFPMPRWHEFTSGEVLADTLARDVAERLGAAVAAKGHAVLAVSGGSTPKLFFPALSRQRIDWSKVIVTLVDERFVPETSERSNAALVKTGLLINEAAAARFVGLYHDADTVGAAARLAGADLSDLPWPIDVVVLGMGTDGHTASFFPDAANLDDLLDPARTTLVEPVLTQDGGEPRLTLPLARLMQAGSIVLHIEGGEKRAVLEQALTPGHAKPISAVFAASTKPVPVYWAG